MFAGRSYGMSSRSMSSYLLGWGNKPWERLAKQLKDEGYESKYLNRLQKKVSSLEAEIDELEKEILQETACALRKTEDKVNYALLRLEVSGREINRAETSEERKHHIKEFNKIRLEALDARRDLTIHREAVGMRIRNWDRMQTLYPIPSVCKMDATFAPVVKQESPTTLQQLEVHIREARLAK